MQVATIRDATRVAVVSLVLVVAGVSFLAGGCGSSSGGDAAPVADAASDVGATDATAVSDASAKPSTAVDACATDADIRKLDVPDASFGSTGNASGCYDCMKAKCGAEVDACAASCDCSVAAESLFKCLGQGSAMLTCGQAALSAAGPGAAGPGQTMLTCIMQSCPSVCAVYDFLDSGPKPPADSSPSASDAADDGG